MSAPRKSVDALRDLLVAAIERSEAQLPPFFSEGEWGILEIKKVYHTGYDRAKTIIRQMIDAGEAVEVGIRRRHDGGKQAMAYKLVVK